MSVQFLGGYDRTLGRKGFPGGLQQVPDDGAVLEGGGVTIQVKPHQELGEGQNGQAGALGDFPALDVLDSFAKAAQDGQDIQSRVIGRQRIKPVDLQAEIRLQLLHQGDVDPRLVFEHPHPEPLTDRTALDVHRNQNDRRKAGHLALV